jgi:hypothetical protein
MDKTINENYLNSSSARSSSLSSSVSSSTTSPSLSSAVTSLSSTMTNLPSVVPQDNSKNNISEVKNEVEETRLDKIITKYNGANAVETCMNLYNIINNDPTNEEINLIVYFLDSIKQNNISSIGKAIYANIKNRYAKLLDEQVRIILFGRVPKDLKYYELHSSTDGDELLWLDLLQKKLTINDAMSRKNLLKYMQKYSSTNNAVCETSTKLISQSAINAFLMNEINIIKNTRMLENNSHAESIRELKNSHFITVESASILSIVTIIASLLIGIACSK